MDAGTTPTTASPAAAASHAASFEDAETAPVEARWQKGLAELGVTGAQMARQRASDPRHRVYTTSDRVYKLYNTRLPGRRGRQDHLRHEYDLVRKCAGITTIPRALAFQQSTSMEAAIYERVDASQLDQSHIGLWRSVTVLAAAIWTAARLSARGIAHNDIQAHNVLLSPNGRSYLIDFDEAQLTGRCRAVYRNFLRGKRPHDQAFHASVWGLAWYLLCSQLGWRYLRYNEWTRQAERQISAGRRGRGIWSAFRAVTMRPWRTAAWRLIGGAMLHSANHRTV